MLAKTPAGFLPLLRIGVPAGVMRNYDSRKKVARERLDVAVACRLNELDELEGLRLAGGVAVDLA